jgi:hypothetical protein
MLFAHYINPPYTTISSAQRQVLAGMTPEMINYEWLFMSEIGGGFLSTEATN